MNTNLYMNLKNTCNRLNNYFRGMDHIEFSAQPKLNKKSGRIEDMAILISLNIELRDWQVTEAEKIAHKIKNSIKKDR